MALEGTIRDFGLPDIFQLIGLQRKTGLLTLRHEKEEVTVTFEGGLVVMADSSSKRLEDRLGNVLVKQSKISKDKLDDALQTQRATLQRLGHVLIANNYITQKDLREALQVQVSQIVFKVFRWRDGEYHFAPTETVDFDRENFTPMSTDFILMEGIRMVDEWPIIEKKIPSMDIVFRTVVEPGLIEVGSSEDGEEALGSLGETRRPAAGPSSKIRLTPEEERIYRKIDGTRTVQAVIDSTGLGEFEVCRTLFDLLNRNIIATAGRGAAKEQTVIHSEEAVSMVPGLALIVTIAVLALGALVVQRAEPFGVIGRGTDLQESYGQLKASLSESRLERIDRAVLAFRLARGSVPETLRKVAAAGLIDPALLVDPWGRPYHFALTSNGYLLSAVDDRGQTLAGTLRERVLSGER